MPLSKSPLPPSYSAFAGFLVPLMLTNILQAISGTLSSVFLGRNLGAEALAVAGTFFPILFLLISFSIGVGAGASVLIGRAFGAGDTDKIRLIAGTAVTATFGCGIASAIGGCLFIDRALLLIGTPEALLVPTTLYARAMLLASPLIFFFMVYSSLLRGMGDTRTPLAALMLMCVVNLMSTPWLLTGGFGFRGFGIEGAGIATILTFSAGLLFIIFDLGRRRHALAFDQNFLPHLRIDLAELQDIFRIGVPTGVQVILISIAELAILAVVNRFGESAVAAYGAVNQVVVFVQFPAVSIAIAASIFGAQALGAGCAWHLPSIIRKSLLLNFIISGCLIAATYAGDRALLGLFLENGHILSEARTILHITLWSHILFTTAGVLVGIMRASGVVWVPTIISMFAIVCVEVPVAYAFSGPFGLEGVWLAYPVAFATLLASQAVYFWFVWRPKNLAPATIAS